MKKKLLTIILVVTFLFAAVLPVIVNADSFPKPGQIESIDSKISGPVNKAITIVQYIAIAIAVIMLIWYGVRYFTAAPEKQGDLKKAWWGYLIGAVCIFGAAAILQIVKGLVDTQVAGAK